MKVTKLVHSISNLTHLEEGEVYLHARKLIDSGILPKARGSAVPDVQVEQVAALLIAVFAVEKPSDATMAVKTWGEDLKNENGTTLRDWLADDLANSKGRVAELDRLVICRTPPRAEMIYPTGTVVFESDDADGGRPSSKVEVTVKGHALANLAFKIEFPTESGWTGDKQSKLT